MELPRQLLLAQKAFRNEHKDDLRPKETGQPTMSYIHEPAPVAFRHGVAPMSLPLLSRRIEANSL